MRTPTRLLTTALTASLQVMLGCGSGNASSDDLGDTPAKPSAPTDTGSQNPNPFGNVTGIDGPRPPSSVPAGNFSTNAPAANIESSPVHGTLAGEFLSDTGDGWLSLIAADWTLAANSEGYLCARMTAPRELYIHAFSPIAPTGTHHTVLSAHPAGDVPDGAESCGTDTSGQNLYGSGVGSVAETMPEGVAMQLEAGQQLQLNLHLFNASDKELQGQSGVRVQTLEKSAVTHIADRVLAGPIAFSLAPGAASVTGGCTFFAGTLLAVGPHMHKLGVHMKVTAERARLGSVVLFDGPYAFDAQQNHPVDAIQLDSGDRVTLECDYQNDTGHTVSFGTSTLDEMCFVSVTRYPAQSTGNYLCSN